MVTATEVDELGAKVVAARYGDLRAYAKAVHGMEFASYQDVWAEALETLTYTAIVCPPDSWKTTTVRLFVEKLIGTDPNIRILWIMGTGAQAEKNVMGVARTIKDNTIYRMAFGVEPDADAQWTKNTLFVRRKRTSIEPTLMATGLDGPYQGLHFDLIVIDDPTTPQDIRSPSEMENQRGLMRGMILDRLVEGGRIVAIFTRWGSNDLADTFVEMGFDMVVMPLVGDYPWGPTINPDRFPPSRIQVLRDQKGDALFQLTYMCNPQAVEGNLVRREHILYWDRDTLPEAPLAVFMGVDPAASKKTWADRSAIASIGLDLKTRKKYLLDLFCARLEVPDLRLEIVKRARRTAGLRAIGLETTGFQLSLLQDLKRMCQLPIKEIPYRSRRQVMHRVVGMDRDKTGRVLYLDSQFTSGRLYIPKDLPLVEGVSFESELCGFMP
ncbi:MAG: hypothetical protein ACOY58_00780, partial [Candidatus Micrarchaeota archaeon]